MSDAKSKGRGRPKIAEDSVSVTVIVAGHVVEMANEVVADLDRLGLPSRRVEVLRSALTRGVHEMKKDVEERLRTKQ